MATPLQTKVDAIQAKVNEQNRAKALQNVANVQTNVDKNNAAKTTQQYADLADPTKNPRINQVAPST